MKNAGKIVIKSIIFVLIFAVLFLVAQEILREKTEYTEELTWRYESFREQVNSGMDIDVIYMGSSPLYAAVSPMAIWQEKGYTGMNFGTSKQNIMSLYYLFSDILEYSEPKVLVIDFRDLHEARLADDMDNLYSYRKAYDNISSKEVKKAFVKEVMESTDSIQFMFPMVYFHDRWDTLGKSDLIPPASKYVECTKGALMSQKHAEVNLVGTYDENLTPSPYNKVSLKYYDMLVELCKTKEIQLIGLIPPTAEIGENMADYNAIAKYCREKDIVCLNYNSSLLLEESGIDFKKDFYNNGHINTSGAVKLSRSLATHLEELCELTDHRGDSLYKSWESDSAEFTKKYIIKE